ncbi:uncharacterized protein CTRU02_211328 [Colletotrichum truncatum]|uniref:Uncharacterized protein n=1 Tax=Colletotrichum truncatum TaxID=5467 RepID=A0ACC3YRG7_COLTU|nr:uncharacterized protein CTRU02_02105 [Colletotrichum truncatum]KAF6799234.1 hypothetical protein CTRU02_02105 [Colletotrichum truncatum]
MKALTLTPKTRSVAVQDIPTPKPGPREIVVHVRAVALNHVDALYTANPVAVQDYRVVGSDFAGEVVRVGSEITGLDDPRTKIGTQVAGFVQGACSVNDRPGAFAEYIAVDYDLTWNIPASMSFEGAATISLCGLTAAQGVFSRLQLPCPFFETEGLSGLDLAGNQVVNVFVYGATTSLGLYAAQLVRLSQEASGVKFHLIGAASTSKAALLKEEPYSYDILVDYRDPSWPQKVRDASGGKGVQFAIDAFSKSPSVELVESTLAENGKFAVFRSPVLGGFDVSKLKIKPVIGAVWEGLGVEILYQGATIPANSEARKFTTEFYNYLGSGASSGHVKLQPNPIRLMSGGLEKIVPEGFPLLGGSGHVKGQLPVSAEKIVYTLS